MEPSPSPWWLYLVRRADGALYTGIATDPQRRFVEHCEGRGAKALRGRGPLALVYGVPVGDRALAAALEHRVKALPKEEKERLVAGGPAAAELLARFGLEGEESP